MSAQLGSILALMLDIAQILPARSAVHVHLASVVMVQTAKILMSAQLVLTFVVSTRCASTYLGQSTELDTSAPAPRPVTGAMASSAPTWMSAC